jgi:hypothetical protein
MTVRRPCDVPRDVARPGAARAAVLRAATVRPTAARPALDRAVADRAAADRRGHAAIRLSVPLPAAAPGVGRTRHHAVSTGPGRTGAAGRPRGVAR